MDPKRGFVRNAKRVIVKVGTAVVSRSEDGKFALGRLGSLCEQVKDLLDAGIEVILVSSGALGMGCQRLRRRRVLTSTFADLGKPEEQLDGKACAAVGQSGLIFFYDSLFSQLDVASSQLLVTNNDFKSTDFRVQLVDTINSLLAMQVVPIFNENDAVSTRERPYKECGGIFWDNDSLAALLALELKADLLILLTDVEGLYTKPPSQEGSKLIHTYIKRKHDNVVTFGEATDRGRGGMDAKVHVAQYAALSGVPVVIASGFVANSLNKVIQGNRIGTLFHKDTFHLANDDFHSSAREVALRARSSSRVVQALSYIDRQKILYGIAKFLETNEELILNENVLDVQDARNQGLSKASIDTLTLGPQKIRGLSITIRRLAEMKDPINNTLTKTKIVEGLFLEKVSSALGVILVLFGLNLDTLVLAAAMAILTGNGVLLHGAKEGSRSQAILYKAITKVLYPDVQEDLVHLTTSRDRLKEFLKLDDIVDLIIVKDENEIISQVKQKTSIPIISHAYGVCHVYVDKEVDMEKATSIILDSMVDSQNAMDILLIHEELTRNNGFGNVLSRLKMAGVETNGDSLCKIVDSSTNCEETILSSKVVIVKDTMDAINHINEDGSAHVNLIITEDKKNADLFLNRVDSCAIFHNTSIRFCDGERFGLLTQIGLSTSKLHIRGPINVEGLLTCRWVLRGGGHIIGDNSIACSLHEEMHLYGMKSIDKIKQKNLDNDGNHHLCNGMHTKMTSNIVYN